MKQRQLGKNGPMVGEVGFGAMSLAGAFGPTDKEAGFRTLEKALELGVSHIDTARIYGPHISEDIIGEFLKAHPGAKQQFSIATKGGIVPNPRGLDNSAAFMRECLEGSLQRLGVESVNLYYVHRRDHSVPIEDVMQTLVTFMDEGKIRGIGLSEVSPATLERASAVHHVAAVQNEYSLWTRLPQLGLIQACERFGTAVVAFSPLARGVLSDVVIDPATLPAKDFRKSMPRFLPEHYGHNMQRINRFKIFAQSRGWTTSALAIAWVLHQAPHIIPIPGTRAAEHLVETAAAADIVLSTDDLAEIENILPAGFAHGNRYSVEQQGSAEQYC